MYHIETDWLYIFYFQSQIYVYKLLIIKFCNIDGGKVGM